MWKYPRRSWLPLPYQQVGLSAMSTMISFTAGRVFDHEILIACCSFTTYSLHTPHSPLHPLQCSAFVTQTAPQVSKSVASCYPIDIPIALAHQLQRSPAESCPRIWASECLHKRGAPYQLLFDAGWVCPLLFRDPQNCWNSNCCAKEPMLARLHRSSIDYLALP
jgi:hypothetical protein